jgi:hypothetical protein
MTKRGLQGPSRLLARTQPYRHAAPYGVRLVAYPGPTQLSEPRAVGYDVAVRQNGALVARVRVAARCGKMPTPFGERLFRCRVTRRKNG